MTARPKDIQTLTLSDFPRTPHELRELLKVAKRPIIVEVMGKAEFVVLDAKVFQHMLKRLDHLEVLEGISESLRSVDRGEGRPAADVFEELRKKYALPHRDPAQGSRGHRRGRSVVRGKGAARGGKVVAKAV